MLEGVVDMKYSDNYTHREFVDQVKVAQESLNITNTPAIQDTIRVANTPAVRNEYQAIARDFNYMDAVSEFKKITKILSNCCKILVTENISGSFEQTSSYISGIVRLMAQLYSNELLVDTFKIIKGIVKNYNLISYHPANMSDEDIVQNEEISNKIITEIYNLDEKGDKNTAHRQSAIIALSPINDEVLKYLSENPETLYQLEDRDFEVVMAEIYNKLGYKVELTKATRDGGKDIIIRKPEILGDFIYYVECKKYSTNKHVGVGIIRNLNSVIDMDRVNGGIIATTSYFTRPAKDLIVDKNLSFQIKLHDYDMIKKLLNQAVK